MKIACLTGCLPNYNPLAEFTIERNKVPYCARHGYELILVNSIRPKFKDQRSHAAGFSWSRLEHMAELVESGRFDWVWCVGCDTLVTNFNRKLETLIELSQTDGAKTAPFPVCPRFRGSTAPPSIVNWRRPRFHPMTGEKHLLITGERVTAIQADSFMVRGTKEGAGYLRDILGYYETYKHHPWVENQAMIDLREKHAALTMIVPQHALNAYDYNLYLSINPAYGSGMDCYGNRGQWMLGDLLIHWPGVTFEQRMQLVREWQPMIVK